MKDNLGDPATCRTCTMSTTDPAVSLQHGGRWRGRCRAKPPASFAVPAQDPQTGLIDWPHASVFPLVNETEWCADHVRDEDKPYVAPPEPKPASKSIIVPRSAN